MAEPAGSPALDAAHFARWLQHYGRAWEQGDPDAIVKLFTETAAYHERPFAEPLIGHAAIHRYWSDGARDAQVGVRFCATLLGLADATGLAHWRASFTRRANGAWVDLDGVLSARLAADGRCCEFREWWHRRETARQP